jgi:hypothetical protein
MISNKKMSEIVHWHVCFGYTPTAPTVDLIVQDGPQSITYYLDFINNIFFKDIKDISQVQVETYLRTNMQDDSSRAAVMRVNGHCATWIPCTGCHKASMN